VSILVAAEELSVVIVLFIVSIDEFNAAEVFAKEELNDVMLSANEELVLVNAVLTSVMDAASEALSKEPVPAAAAAITSILPAKDELEFVNVVFTVVIDAANEELAFIILDDIVSTLEANEELASVKVKLIPEILDSSKELVVEKELLNSSIVNAEDALVVVKESLIDLTPESRVPETLVNDVFNSTICVAADELKVVSVEDS
jgi:hypothetical protein